MKRITETMEVSGVSYIVDRIRRSSEIVSRKHLWEGFLISWMVYSQKQQDRITETWNEVELSKKESEFISQRSSEEHYFSHKA